TEDGGHAVGSFVGANSFEGAESVVERVRENVNLRVVPIDELTIHPDLGDLLDHTKSPESGFTRDVPRLDPFVTASRRRSRSWTCTSFQRQLCYSARAFGPVKCVTSTWTAPAPPNRSFAVAKQRTRSSSGGDDSQPAISSRRTPRPLGECAP